MKDQLKGIYSKFIIERVDGKSYPGEKHHGCNYFVLDITHDPHALPALKAYAESCRKDYPILADDLNKQIKSKGNWDWLAEALCSKPDEEER